MSMDFAIMALRGQYDVGIMFSGDTDLKPSLEFVADLTRSRGKTPCRGRRVVLRRSTQPSPVDPVSQPVLPLGGRGNLRLDT